MLRRSVRMLFVLALGVLPLSGLFLVMPAAAGTTVSVETGSIYFDVSYNGAPPSTTGAACDFNATLDGWGFLGDLCDSKQVDNIPVGQYTLHLGYGFGSGYLLPSVPITISTNTTTTASFDVSNVVGIVTGKILVNGQPPAPSDGYAVCGFTNGKACQSTQGSDASFSLLLPVGAGTGDVYRGCDCPGLAHFTFNVSPGQTTDAGITSVDFGSIYFDVSYNGAPPSTTGAACDFNATLDGWGFLGDLCDSKQVDNIPVGQYTLHLGYGFGSGYLLPSVPITISTNTTTTASFDVSNVVGIVTGKILVNGQPPAPSDGYAVCGFTNGKACQSTQGSDASFSLLLPVGAGTGDVYRGCDCPGLAHFTFNVSPGQTTDAGITSVDFGSIYFDVSYNGAPPSTTGAACDFNATLDGWGFLGDLCDSKQVDNIPVGQYTLHLGYGFGSGSYSHPSQ